MKIAFFTKLILFTLPLVVLFGGTVFLALYSGEALPPRIVYETQVNSPGAIYLTTHRQKDFLYKYFGYQHVRPEVLIIGASRVLTFRAGFLNLRPDAGYNAGIAGGGMPDIEAFIDQLTSETAPEVMLLQVDQFWFNEDWQAFYIARQVNLADVDFPHVAMATRQVIQGIIDGRYTVGQLLSRTSPAYGELALGTDAILTGIGYTADGAIQNSPQYQTPQIVQIRHDSSINDMRQGTGQYVRGDVVSEDALVQLARIVDKALVLDIEVIGFAPGYLPVLYDEMITSGQHSYIEKAMPRVADLFEERDLHFFDFTDPASTGGSAEEMRDGNHPAEMMSMRMYMAMLEGAPELLGPYSDLEGLQAMIDQAVSVNEVVPRQPTASTDQ
jgi:hypothetical protein